MWRILIVSFEALYKILLSNLALALHLLPLGIFLGDFFVLGFGLIQLMVVAFITLCWFWHELFLVFKVDRRDCPKDVGYDIFVNMQLLSVLHQEAQTELREHVWLHELVDCVLNLGLLVWIGVILVVRARASPQESDRLRVIV